MSSSSDNRRVRRTISAIALATVAVALLAGAGVVAQPRELRVCGDPDNLPFSNERLEGFENKVAALIAGELGATVHYTWMPQRRGFVRRTLNAKQCDLVIGVPSEYEMVLPTKPYYSSTYVFVSRKDRNLRIESFDDPKLKKLRIGLHVVGDDIFGTPAAHALSKRGIVKNIVGFEIFDDDSVKDPAGRIINAVAAGKIDVAIVWGPFGGYYAKQQKTPLDVVAVPARTDGVFPFVYDISMGVRRSDKGLKAQVEEVLERRRTDIQKILEAYGVPLVNAAGA
jgi:mxaJ protein